MSNFDNLVSALEINAKDGNKGITFISGEKEEVFVSYSQLYNEALRVLSYLRRCGVKKGEELVFQIEDNQNFIYVFWACLLGGMIPVPVSVGNNDEHRMKLFRIWNILNRPYLVTSTKIQESLQKFSADAGLYTFEKEIKPNTIITEEIEHAKGTAVPSTPSPEDIAFIQFSSGSTGEPKGVVLTHANLMANIYGAAESARFVSEDSFLSWMPLTHDMGMIGCHLVPLVIHMNQYLMPTSLFIRRPALWILKASEHKATLLSSPNFGYKYFLSFFTPEAARDWDLSHVRLIFNGAEPISTELCNKFLDSMKNYGLKRTSMYTVYGMAEACVAVAFPPIDKEFGSVNLDRRFLNVGQSIVEVDSSDNNCITLVDEGYPVANCSIRVCDGADKVLEDYTVGYVQIKGKNVTSGYYNNRKATKKSITEDGWLNTGDLGFTRNGRIVITGRAKDIIFVNGQNYYPHDIERVAEEVEGIELGSIVACGVHNKELQTDEIVVFVVFKKGLDAFVPLAAGLKKHLNIRGGWDIGHVVPIKKVPKTTSGKVQRYKLGEQYLNGKFSHQIEKVEEMYREYLRQRNAQDARGAVEERLLEISREVLGNKTIGLNDNFFEVGVNSLLLTRIADRVEEHFPGRVRVSDFFAYPTISKLAGYVENGESSLKGDTNHSAGKKIKDIAIIGMALRFPMADSREEFWENIRDGKDCITEFPDSRRRDAQDYLHFKGLAPEQMRFMPGGYLREIDKFDSALFRLTPREANLMNPNQRLFLEVAWEAVEDAGYGDKKLAGGKTGVYAGYIGDVEGYKYKQMVMDADEASASISMSGNLSSIIPSRISYLLDLKGPAVLVDTACSSSLVAVHLACQAIRNGECDTAIAGGVKLSLFPLDNREKVGFESPAGRSRTFDDGADGTGIGEGAGAILLKPLDKALRDGDNIYAVIKGTATNQDGASIGITAPNALAQADVIDEAWRDAGIRPETISYIEAHGTGTKLGDPVEIDGITRAFRRHSGRNQFCAIGSVKTNIGHLFEAAGIASLIKTVLALQHGEIPPSLHFAEPNSKISFEDGPVYVSDRVHKWEPQGFPRRAGISSFGFSGTNCHIVVEECPEEYRNRQGKDCGGELLPRILTVSAKSREGLERFLESYKIFAGENNGFTLKDICYTASTGRGHYSHRLALVVRDQKDFAAKAGAALEAIAGGKEPPGVYYGEHSIVPDSKKDRNAGEISEDEKRVLSARAHKLVKEYAETGKSDEGVLEQICRLYIQGADMGWEDLFTGETVRRASLPPYPFERKRCWVQIPGAAERLKELKDRENLYHTVGWRPEELKSGTDGRGPGSILIFKDTTGKGDSLARRLRESGREVLEVAPGQGFERTGKNTYSVGTGEKDYSELANAIRGCRVSHMVHMFTVTGAPGPDSLEELEEVRDKGVYSLFYWIKSMVGSGMAEETNLLLVSEYINGVTGQERAIKPGNAMLAGLGRVIGAEYPHIRCRCLDADDDVKAEDILAEMYEDSGAYQAAYRHGKRFVEEFGNIRIEDTGAREAGLKEGGVYMITGGTGGIGLEIAKYMASRCKVKLGLVCRSKIPEREKWEEILEDGRDGKACAKIRTLRELEMTGAEVTVISADISDMDSAHNAVAVLKGKYGRINGIIHSAGIAGNGFMVTKDKREFEQVLRPKVQGTWILDRLTAGENLDFFILFSSALAAFGTPGQGDYAAANAYLDSYAALGNRQGRNFLAVDWVAWKETGMAKEYGFNGDTVFKAIATHKAIEAFERILDRNLTRVVIGELNYGSKEVSMLEKLPMGISGEIKAMLEKHSGKPQVNIKMKGKPAGEEGSHSYDVVVTDATGNVIARLSDCSAGMIPELMKGLEKGGTGEQPLRGSPGNPLPSVELKGKAGNAYTGTERQIARIWADVLGYEEIDIYKSFYELGGDSILATKVINSINTQMNRRFSVVEMFNHPSVSNFSAFLDGQEGEGDTGQEACISIAAAGEREYYPVSAEERRLYAAYYANPGSTAYNLPFAISIEGELDEGHFIETFKGLVERHEILRTSFRLADGIPVQKVHKNLDIRIECTESDESRLKDTIGEFIRPFILGEAPLFRAELLKLSHKHHMLLLDIHHISADGISLGIFFRELIALYKGSELPLPGIQYKDYAAWQDTMFQDDKFRKQEEYWQQVFSGGIPVLDLPTDFPRPDIQSFEGDSIEFVLDENMAAAFKKLLSDRGATLYMGLLAAYNILLAKYTGQEDIVVGTPAGGRISQQLENVMGMFVNMLPIRNHPAGDKTFEEFLEEVRGSALQAYDNQYCRFEELAAKLGVKREMNRNPLFDTMLVLQNVQKDVETSNVRTPKIEFDLGDIRFRTYGFEHKISKYDLTIEAVERDGQVVLYMEYCTRLFREETVRKMAERYLKIIHRVTADEKTKIKDIDILDEGVKNAVVSEILQNNENIMIEFDF